MGQNPRGLCTQNVLQASALSRTLKLRLIKSLDKQSNFFYFKNCEIKIAEMEFCAILEFVMFAVIPNWCSVINDTVGKSCATK